MQAVICKEKHDPDCKELEDYLSHHNILCHYINNLSEIEDLLPKLNPESPYLLYRNPLMRIPHPEKILAWLTLHPEFDSVQAKDVYNNKIHTSYWPSRTHFSRDTVVSEKDLKDEEAYPFALSAVDNVPARITYDKPDVGPAHIFVLAHHRDVYLRLSLNSLFYSIDDTVPVTIFLNEATNAVRSVALEFMHKYSNVDVVSIETNCYHAFTGFALQYCQPESFVVWEEDFILPPITRVLFPHWPYQFAHRLKTFDLVGWGCITENVSYWDKRLGGMFPRTDYRFYDWIYGRRDPNKEHWVSSVEEPLILGQAMAMTTEFWKSCPKDPKWGVPVDGELVGWAKRGYCLPGLRGYHIGWNSHMDGVNPTTSHAFFEPVTENTLTSLKTGEKWENLKLA